MWLNVAKMDGTAGDSSLSNIMGSIPGLQWPRQPGML